jgi:hypothetical protein
MEAARPDTTATTPNTNLFSDRIVVNDPPAASPTGSEGRTPCLATQASRSWQMCRTHREDDVENYDCMNIIGEGLTMVEYQQEKGMENTLARSPPTRV